MKAINDKIGIEIKKSVALRSLALDDKCSDNYKVREEQDKIYKKIQFLKKLNKEMEKRKNV